MKPNAMAMPILLLIQVFVISAPIDRKAWVTRHNPTLRKLDANAPMTVGNGGFACSADITWLQTFAEYYYREVSCFNGSFQRKERTLCPQLR